MKVVRGQRQSQFSGTLQFGGRLKKWLYLGLFLGSLGLGIGGSPESALAENAPEVLIRVINYAQVQPGSVKTAEREASRIFSAAGLQTQWVNCSGKGSAADTLIACSQPSRNERSWRWHESWQYCCIGCG